MNMKKRKAIILLLLALLLTPAYSATFYDNGSQRFVINAGVNFPLTITTFSDSTTYFGMGYGNTNLSLGGYGSLTYQVFLNSFIALGGEIGYNFNFWVDDTLLTLVPLQAKLTFFPLQGRFDLPISLGVGGAYLSSGGSETNVTLFASFELGFDYYITDHWGIGLKTGLWLVPELMTDSNATANNALATYIPLTIAATYRQ